MQPRDVPAIARSLEASELAPVFLGVDDPSGPRNLLGLATRQGDKTVRVAHRLQVLAQVRNVVTHRAPADSATLRELRRASYGAFEELTALV